MKFSWKRDVRLFHSNNHFKKRDETNKQKGDHCASFAWLYL